MTKTIAKMRIKTSVMKRPAPNLPQASQSSFIKTNLTIILLVRILAKIRQSLFIYIILTIYKYVRQALAI